MHLKFYKYQGSGNDFVVIDDRNSSFDISNKERITHICNRNLGVGADGLILLRNHLIADFEMLYFNSDGNQGSMCGNGGRCAVHFANYLEITGSDCIFMAIDGLHKAKSIAELISLKMMDVEKIDMHGDSAFLDTGSPHYINFVSDLKNFNVLDKGREIRYSDRFKVNGTNVNFVEIQSETCFVRTYERGVEEETLSCGTGVVAVTIAAHYMQKSISNPLKIKTRGGDLSVSFEENDGFYSNIWLTGPAVQVYKGVIEC